MGNASEAAAECAIAVLKRAIDAAENSNQAGENFVCAAAAAPELLKELEEFVFAVDTGQISGAGIFAFSQKARAAIAKARGQ